MVKANSKPKDRNDLTEHKGREDRRARANSNSREGHKKVMAKADSKPKDHNGLTEHKGREDRRARANSNSKEGHRKVTAKVNRNSKDRDGLTENKGRVAVNLDCKAAAHSIVRRWHVCAKTPNLENVCAIA